jgi:hypothetical protein
MAEAKKRAWESAHPEISYGWDQFATRSAAYYGEPTIMENVRSRYFGRAVLTRCPTQDYFIVRCTLDYPQADQLLDYARLPSLDKICRELFEDDASSDIRFVLAGSGSAEARSILANKRVLCGTSSYFRTSNFAFAFSLSSRLPLILIADAPSSAVFLSGFKESSSSNASNSDMAVEQQPLHPLVEENDDDKGEWLPKSEEADEGVSVMGDSSSLASNTKDGKSVVHVEDFGCVSLSSPSDILN